MFDMSSPCDSDYDPYPYMDDDDDDDYGQDDYILSPGPGIINLINAARNARGNATKDKDPLADLKALVEEVDMTKENDFTDVAVVVDEKKMYFNSELLCLASPVFKQMLKPQGAGEGKKEIVIDDGSHYNDVRDLLRWISPTSRCQVKETNVRPLLELAEKYQMRRLKEECTQMLSQQLDGKQLTADQCAKTLLLAESHDLKSVFDKAVDNMARFDNTHVESSEFKSLEAKTQEQVLQKRVSSMEERMREILDKKIELTVEKEKIEKKPASDKKEEGKDEKEADTLTEKFKNYMRNMTEERSKLQDEQSKMQRALSDIKNAWTGGPVGGVCGKHKSMKGTRDYECTLCTREFGFYMKTKLQPYIEKKNP